jgi:hypothetical protein
MTFARAKQIAEHQLGGAPDSRISKGYIVNQALLHLYDAYSWSWKRKIAALASVADTATIALPADFETIDSIEGPADSTLRVEFVGIGDLLSLIRQNASYTDTLYVTLIAGDANNLYQHKLRVYPVPTATNAAYLNLAYASTFTRFIEDDSLSTDDAKLAPVPTAFEGVLSDLIRAKAQSEEIDPANPYWQLATQRIEMLIKKDRELAPPVQVSMYTTQRAMLGGEIDANLYPGDGVTWVE